LTGVFSQEEAMNPKRTLPVGRSLEMVLFTRFLDGVGVPWRERAERLGLPPHIPSSDTFLPTIPVLQFLSEIVIREDFAEMSARASLDAQGEIKRNQPLTQLEANLLAAPSLYVGLQEFCTGSAKYWSRFRFWLRETERHLWVCSLLPVRGCERGHEQQVQSRMIRLVDLIQQYLGFRWRPDAMLLETALPSRLLAEAMDCPRIVVGARCSAIPIPVRLLSRSGPVYRPGRAEMSHARRSKDEDGIDWTWLRSLEAVLPEYVVEYQPSIAQIAEIAHVSSRTLQRELAAEGKSFRALLDGARYTVARRKLAEPDLKIEEIGLMLGYTQATHFSRAFRRFAGQTPSQYRSMLQAHG
jgi:AraC-like DNA-binding protein